MNMKKQKANKIIATMLTLVMLIAMIPANVFAADPASNTITTYEGLTDALYKAGDGDTIQLGADVNDTTGIPAMFNPSTSRTVTLDLNGKTISSAGSIAGGMGIVCVLTDQANATLNITDSIGGGKIGVDAYIAVSAVSMNGYAATLNISGGTISSTDIAIYNDTSLGGTSNVNVSGGTILAPTAYTKVDGSSTPSLKITGGTIRGAIATTPTNGSANVYLTTITLSDVTSETAVTAITGATGYLITGMKTDTDGKVYLWLPASTTVTAVTAGGTTYTGSVTVAADNNNTATFTSGPSIAIGTQPTSTTTLTYGAITGNLTVSGTVSNSNAISYQWYKHTTNSSTGGTIINGATSASFTIPTDLNVGTYYYYCVLTATDCEDKASNVATVSVNKADATTSMKAVSTSVSKYGKTGATVILPVKPAGATYGILTVSGDITMTDMSISGNTLTYTAPASTAGQTGTIIIPVTNATNYNNYDITVTITTVDKTVVAITGLSGETNLIYNGNTHNGYTGEVAVEGNHVPVNELVYTYTSTDSGGYNSTTAPTNAGTYKLVVSISDSNATYIGKSTGIIFNIGKATVTIKADNKSAYVGESAPVLTYITTGLATNESLKIVPTLIYDPAKPDMTKAGTVVIRASSAEVPDGGNYNEDIIYVDGTLTISKKSSDNSGGSVGGGSSYSGGGTSTYTNHTPEIISGAKQTIIEKNNEQPTFRIDRPFRNFLYVEAGKTVLVEGTHYTVKEGSTIVTLLPAYTNTLSVGTHTVRVEFIDGYAVLEFEVKPKATTVAPTAPTVTPPASYNPQTGDSWFAGLFF